VPDPSSSVPSAAGRVALVMGGEAGLGAAVVRALAGTGHAVAIHAHAALGRARNLAEELTAAGVPSLALTADLREDGPVRTVVHRVADRFGRIDALVTCAAVASPCRLEDLTADDLRMHFDVNCIGAFVAAQEAADLMARQASGGSIVLVGEGPHEQPPSGRLAAVLSRGAIPHLALCLAAECRARHPRVRVDCVVAGETAAEAGHDPTVRAILSLVQDAAAGGG
jgi:NAD(P)-dependent dehydrogenase (short-subunit alcohol dehydrogenase family)